MQVMHLGSHDDEPATVAALDAFLEENGYENDWDRLHHEIYLSDPGTVRAGKVEDGDDTASDQNERLGAAEKLQRLSEEPIYSGRDNRRKSHSEEYISSCSWKYSSRRSACAYVKRINV